jgi:hypothetical protein
MPIITAAALALSEAQQAQLVRMAASTSNGTTTNSPPAT